MEQTVLTGTGLSISKACIGAMTFGGKLSQADALRSVDLALERGINFIDTANRYTDGESERVVGEALKGRRNQFVLASKVGFPNKAHPNEQGLSRRHILQAVDESLKRLQTDYLDIYYLHKPDFDTPIEETLRAVDDLVRSGKVRYLGMSNFSAWSICDAKWICDTKGYVPPVVTEMGYNLLARGLEDELAPMQQAKKIGMCIFNPLAGGLLTGKHRPGDPTAGTRFALNPIYRDRYWLEENFDAVERLSAVAANFGESILSFSLRWCLNHSFVDSIIIGYTSLEQMEQNLAALEKGPLPAEALPHCDAVWAQMTGNHFNYHR